MAGRLKIVDVNVLPPTLFNRSNQRFHKNRRGGASTSSRCSYAAQIEPSLVHHYRTLRLQPGASEDDVKKSFRKLALQYHPDVCKEANGKVQFQTINEAYDVVMNSLREESIENEVYGAYNDVVPDENEAMRGMFDSDYDLWEEWMGWEGAGIRDYSSHINPYI